MTLKKADILFLLAAWPEKDRDIWDINCPCRALENSIHLVAVNRWGQEGDTKLFGGSQLIGPRGQRLARAVKTGESLMFAHIDLALQASTRREIPYLKDRKIEAYTSILQDF